MLVYVLHALVFLPVYPFQKSELFRQIHTVVPMQLGSAGVTFFLHPVGFSHLLVQQRGQRRQRRPLLIADAA